jgi:hypothetical protein
VFSKQKAGSCAGGVCLLSILPRTSPAAIIAGLRMERERGKQREVNHKLLLSGPFSQPICFLFLSTHLEYAKHCLKKSIVPREDVMFFL